MLIYLKDYLSSRCFQVRNGQSLSHEFLQENGVLQGGGLSTTWFIALNTISSFIPSTVSCCQCVDDLLIHTRTKDVNTRQDTIRQLENWGCITGFKFPVEKSRSRMRRNPTPKLQQYNTKF